MSVLINTGSDLSFVSRRVAKRLEGDSKQRNAVPTRVRLINGETTLLLIILTTRITLGTFRVRMELRILDWDAYDVILGID